jgi:hypothetical protein
MNKWCTTSAAAGQPDDRCRGNNRLETLYFTPSMQTLFLNSILIFTNLILRGSIKSLFTKL